MQNYISIHAPVKGATSMRCLVLQNQVYFNPRSREGSDTTNHRSRSAVSYFNPRSREGSDGISKFLHRLRLTISIHAPVKGATE